MSIKADFWLADSLTHLNCNRNQSQQSNHNWRRNSLPITQHKTQQTRQHTRTPSLDLAQKSSLDEGGASLFLQPTEICIQRESCWWVLMWLAKTTRGPASLWKRAGNAKHCGKRRLTRDVALHRVRTEGTSTTKKGATLKFSLRYSGQYNRDYNSSLTVSPF